jgi:hypothetical protein
MLCKKPDVKRSTQQKAGIFVQGGHLLTGAAAVGSALLLLACGGGGGGSKPVPKPPSVIAVAETRTTQGSSGESLLAYRFALIDSPLYPLAITYRISGAKPGASCAGGADYYLVAAPGLTTTVSATEASGSFTISSAADARKINVMACPGTAAGDKALTLSWSEGTGSGSAIGTIRGATNTSLANSKVLNDTGITACATDSANGQVCPQSAFPGQDAESGRDVAVAVTGVGASRTTAYALSTLPQGDCIQDNVTGLVWEGKTAATGLRSMNNTYSWFNSDAASNGGVAGTSNGGACTGTGACDTETYVAAVNTAALCGFSDWRLPSAQELTTLLDLSVASGASVNSAIVNQAAGLYWTASQNAAVGTGATYVDFDSGSVGYMDKNQPAYVRLVRGR